MPVLRRITKDGNRSLSWTAARMYQRLHRLLQAYRRYRHHRIPWGRGDAAAIRGRYRLANLL